LIIQSVMSDNSCPRSEPVKIDHGFRQTPLPDLFFAKCNFAFT